MQLGYDKWTNNFYGNKQLVLNSIHYLADNFDRLLIRQKQWDFNLLDPQKIASRGLFWKIGIFFFPILLPLLLGGFVQRGRSKHQVG